MNFDGLNKSFGYGIEDMNEGGGFILENNDNLMQSNIDKKFNLNNEQKLAPLKISMILRSYSNFVTLSRFQLFDKDINLFKLVGFVRNVEHEDYPQRLRFYLDDGSGLILIDWLVDNTGTNYKQRLINSINEGCFVKIFGELTLMVSEPSVRAFVVRPLVCTDEISLHDIDVATFIVRNIYSNTNVLNEIKISNSTSVNRQNNNINNNECLKNSNQNIVSSMFNLNGQFNGNNIKDNNDIINMNLVNNINNDQNVPNNRPIKVVSAIASRSNINNPHKLRDIISSILEQASNEGNPEMTIDNIFDSLIVRDIHVTQEEIRNQLKNLVNEAKVCQTNPHLWRSTGY